MAHEPTDTSRSAASDDHIYIDSLPSQSARSWRRWLLTSLGVMALVALLVGTGHQPAQLVRGLASSGSMLLAYFTPSQSLDSPSSLPQTLLPLPYNSQIHLNWFWTYSCNSTADSAYVHAAGTLVSDGEPDQDGFYRVTSITGQRNGVLISGLHPASDPLSGRLVDNLVRLHQPRAGRPNQLTAHGVGMKLVDGALASPHFDAARTPSAYVEPYSISGPVEGSALASLQTLSECVASFSAFPLSRPQQTVTLIRHAERPKDPFKIGTEDLSPQGLQRAQCLAAHFASKNAFQCVFASAPSIRGTSRRSFETAQPIAARLQLPLHSEFADTDELTDALKSATGCDRALVVWDAESLPTIMAKLGVAHIKEYPDDRYDLMFDVRAGSVSQSSQPAECTFA